ncbi:MAG: hypothetical protein ACM3PZ_00100 [Bacillota bacterium]
MKEYEFFKAAEKGTKINESEDRDNLQSRDREKDEDELFVEKNDPRKHYTTIDDIADNSYLNYGEEPEPEPEVPEEEPDERIIMSDEPIITDISNEAGLIGAAHADGKSVLINREKGDPLDHLEIDDDGLQEKYAPVSEEIQRKYQPQKENRYQNVNESHHGDNLKTLTSSKQERSLRGKIRQLFKSL